MCIKCPVNNEKYYTNNNIINLGNKLQIFKQLKCNRSIYKHQSALILWRYNLTKPNEKRFFSPF